MSDGATRMQEILRQLQRLQRTSRALLVAQRVALLIAIALAAALLIALVDYIRPMPQVPRLIIWLIGIGAIVWTILTYIRPAVRFRPDLTAMALRVERMLPRVAGRLASSVEFVRAGIDQSNPLAARAIRETQRRLAGESMRRMIRASRVVNAGLALAAVALLLVTLFLLTPTSARIGVARVLAPWSDATWPARTGVVSLMHEVVSPANVYERGQALLLRAEVTRGRDEQRVDAMIRYQVGGEYQRWKQLVLTHQNDGRHERLIDTDADAVELYFQTADARTDAMRIELVPAPAVDRATLVVTPPDYAEPAVASMTEELGPGVDDRSVASFASFVGSDARLLLMLNKNAAVPGGYSPSADWLRNTFGWDAEQLPDFVVDPADQRRWQLTWTVRETADIELELRDQYGLTNSEPITYRIAARVDRVPSVTITEPPSDQVVLPTAVIALQASAEDDVALRNLSLEAQLRRAISDQSAQDPQPQPADETIWTQQLETSDPAATISEELDLAQFELTVGDVILVTAYARDSFELGGVQHEPAESTVRRLQIISELDYATQIRRQLGGIRQNAIRIESLQGELQEDIIDDGMQPGVAGAQAQIGQRIAEQREMIERLAEDVQRNRLDDEQLENLLGQSGDLLDYAGRASTRAAEQIEQRRQQGSSTATRPGESAQRGGDSGARDDEAGDAAQAPRSGESQPSDEAGTADEQPEADEPYETHQPAEEDREIVDAQQQVRDELADLIELLDRDEDTWIITRRLENLLQQQQELANDTQQLSEQTVGRSISELTPEERTELERIVERQRELGDEARQVIEESRDRAEAMQEIDPQSARGMRNAADTAEQRELDQDMQRAAQRAQQNQLNSARAAQRSAAQTLEQMLEDIDETRRAQAQELLRQLASLVESIERLVNVQENELIVLAQAEATDEYAGRDRAMIRLNQNTIAVEGEARAAGQQARRIARSLDRAGDAQGAAIVALRAAPIVHDDALEAEERSLELLKEALTLARELEQQVQEDEVRRQRESLIEQYRELSERQMAFREETIVLSGLEQLDRRELVEARRLGNAQDRLRTDLLDMQAATSELNEAIVFKHVHELIDEWSITISESLWDGNIGTAVPDRQFQIAESIGLLIDALNESMSPPEEFAHGEQSDGGQGGGQGGQAPLIPPVVELKLVRGIQEQIYNQTRKLEGAQDVDESGMRVRLRELGRRQRELLEIGDELVRKMMSQAPEPIDQPPLEPVPDEDSEQ